MEHVNMKYDLSMVDPDDPKTFDYIHLDSRDFLISLIKFIIISSIAIFVFFVPIGSEGNILFGMIYNALISLVDRLVTINGVQVGSLLICTIILVCTGVASIYGKYFASEESAFNKYFATDSIIHPILYMLGGIFIFMYFLDQTALVSMPQWIVGPETAGMVIPGVVIGVAAIIPVGAALLPFITDYGLIDFVGVFLEKLMRPLFKVPGKASVDACASFVGSTTMGIILTGRMYQSNNYTGREAGIVATCFSAVSVGYAYVVMESAQITQYFVPTYFVSFFLAFVIAFFICRMPPVSRLSNVYANGKEQVPEDKDDDLKFGPQMFKVGVTRAANKAYYSGNIFTRIVRSVVDSFPVLPKVITLLCAFGVLGMMVANYTPIFNWIGYLILPITKVLGVPDPMAAAAAIPAGITEMYIPVLTIAGRAAELHIKTRFFVTVVSMLQIIFLAESVVVIMNVGIPIKFKDLMIVFVQRTLIAMPLTAIFMHLMF